MAPYIAEEELPQTIPTPTSGSKNFIDREESLLTKDHHTTFPPSSSPTPKPTYQSIAHHRQQQISSSTPPEWRLPLHILQLNSKHPINLVKTCGLLNEREIEIVYSNAVTLLDKMRRREYTAVEVTRAFCMASAVAHQATNCLAWSMYDSALSLAAELDAHMEATGKPVGPLHGLPISVKEHLYLIDTPSTSGFVAWANNFCTSKEQEGVCIKVLRSSGAIFHVKTTNPQGLMALETSSNLYGTTTNPLNTTLSPGGSSGGESALIAMHGSILGIGTDIGGSIRVPAISCGLYALKPSVARLPHSGLSGAHDGMESIVGVVGPIATCMDDVEIFCKTLLDAEPWRQEVGLLPIPWGCRDGNKEKKEKEEMRKLRIGIIYTDEVHTPHPPITRVLHATASQLKAAGHEILPFPTHLHQPITQIIDALYLLDNGAEYITHLSHTSEPATPLLQWLLSKPTTKSRSIPEQWVLHQQRNRLQNEYAKIMEEMNVDCIIAPGGVSVANAHEEARYWGYTSVFNGLDLPVFCLPVGEVQEGDCWEGISWGDEENGAKEMDGAGGLKLDSKLDGNKDHKIEEREKETEKSEMEKQWGEKEQGAKKYEGGSVGIQIIGRRLEEEKLLRMVRIIESDLGL
ncbi:hypothetical protein EAF04_002443 [Stromatinia cepivora]|nr:hypothetical protein EAF04_002443 [Stromatinia cepivora]